jgi:hypothetical protein
MVEALSVRTGVIGDSRGRVVWAEVPWSAEGRPAEDVFAHAHQEAIAAAERGLRERFDEFVTWFG